MQNSFISPQLARKIKSVGIDLTTYATKYLRDNFYVQYYYNNNNVLEQSESYEEDMYPILSIIELQKFFELDKNLFIEITQLDYVSHYIKIFNSRTDEILYEDTFDIGDIEEMYLIAFEMIIDYL